MAGLHEIWPHEMADGIRPRTSAAWNRGGTCGPAIGRNWGGDAATAGHVAFRRRPHAGARFRGEERQGGGTDDQLARRLAGAVAPDLPADQAARHGEEIAGA